MNRNLIITQTTFIYSYRSCTLLSSATRAFREAASERYLISPTSQNKMTDIIGKNIIQATLVDGVKKAGLHLISADEVT